MMINDDHPSVPSNGEEMGHPQLSKISSQNSLGEIIITSTNNSLEMDTFHFPQNYDHHLSPISLSPCLGIKYRIFIGCVTLFIVIFGQILTTPSEDTRCVLDTGHQFTSPINQLINENHKFASALQILSSLILDVTFVSTLIYWFAYTRTLRFFCALLCFYAIRLFHVQLLQINYAPGYYWEHPGIPSLLVKYGFLNDFFYSGHCGFLMLCGLEWNRVGQHKVFYALMVACLFQGFIALAFRTNYSIDVPGSFVYAHYLYRLICDHEVQIDYYNKKILDCILNTCGIHFDYSPSQLEMKEIKLSGLHTKQ